MENINWKIEVYPEDEICESDGVSYEFLRDVDTSEWFPNKKAS